MNRSTAKTPVSSLEQERRGGHALIFKLLRLGIAACLLYYVSSRIGVARIFDRATAANAADLALAFLVFVFVQYLAAFRLKKLLAAQAIEQPVVRVLEVNLVAKFYGLFLPGGNLAALLVRMFKFTREGAQMPSIVIALFADRILATLSLCLVGLLFWWFAPADVLWLLIFAAAFVACSILAVALFVRPLLFMPDFLVKLLERIAPRIWEKMSVAMRRSRLSGEQVLTTSLVLSVAMHLVGTVGYWFVAASLDIPLTLIEIGWVRAALMLATLLPITISGLGVRELATLLLLSRYGIEPDAAIAFSLLIFATMAVGIGLLGGLAEALRFTLR